jgi:hypothetical protein
MVMLLALCVTQVDTQQLNPSCLFSMSWTTHLGPWLYPATAATTYCHRPPARLLFPVPSPLAALLLPGIFV